MTIVDLSNPRLDPEDDDFVVEHVRGGFEFAIGEAYLWIDMAKTRRLLAFMVNRIEGKDAA